MSVSSQIQGQYCKILNNSPFLFIRIQHLSSTILPAVAGQQADSQAVSDIDFYIDQVINYSKKLCENEHVILPNYTTNMSTHYCVQSLTIVSTITLFSSQGMIHIADTKVARRYGDYFLRQINKLQDVSNEPFSINHFSLPFSLWDQDLRDPIYCLHKSISCKFTELCC